jgi:hypothetical protein
MNPMHCKTLFAFLLPAIVTGACMLGPTTVDTDTQGRRLALRMPSNQWMRQGSTDGVSVAIERTGHSDPVSIQFRNLPAGVTVDQAEIPANESHRTFTLIAAADAAVVVDHPVTIEASAAGLSTSQQLLLTVKPKG